MLPIIFLPSTFTIQQVEGKYKANIKNQTYF